MDVSIKQNSENGFHNTCSRSRKQTEQTAIHHASSGKQRRSVYTDTTRVQTNSTISRVCRQATLTRLWTNSTHLWTNITGMYGDRFVSLIQKISTMPIRDSTWPTRLLRVHLWPLNGSQSRPQIMFMYTCISFHHLSDRSVEIFNCSLHYSLSPYVFIKDSLCLCLSLCLYLFVCLSVSLCLSLSVCLYFPVRLY